MKKFLAAILSLSLCGSMLSACGNSGSAENGTSDSITSSESVSETEKTEETSETTEETTETTETESETAAPSSASYGSIDEFAGADGIFDLPNSTVSAADSLTYAFSKSLEGAKELYLDVEASGGNMSMVMAVSGSSIYMKTAGASDGQSVDMTILIKDSMMYMLDNSTKTGYYYTVDEETLGEYNIEGLLEEFSSVDMDKEIESAADVKVCTVEIGGKEYSFETAGTGAGFLFDGDKLYAIIPADRSQELNALLINDFSSDVPGDIFDIPADYQLTDLSAAMGGEQ